MITSRPAVGVSKITLRHRGVDRIIELWPSLHAEGWWYWAAGGKDGCEPSKEAAERVARRWVKDGQ